MSQIKTARPVRALGLCSGGLDSILSALVLRQQGIETAWVSFETPFFSARQARKAASITGIRLITRDITDDYMEMMKAPKAGFGKNMNPCMDCHALMFAKAGKIMEENGFDFLFSGEVVGQRPKSQNKNSLRYVEKNSGYDGFILRPLSAKLLPETQVERQGLVDREQLHDISGRGRKPQMEMARQFGITEYPSPAGGCLLTDQGFSKRLKDLMQIQRDFETHELFLLQNGRHFRLDPQTKVIAGRSRHDNTYLIKHADPKRVHVIRHASLPGPAVILTGNPSRENLETAARICAAYTRAVTGEPADIEISWRGQKRTLEVITPKTEEFKALMV